MEDGNICWRFYDKILSCCLEANKNVLHLMGFASTAHAYCLDTCSPLHFICVVLAVARSGSEVKEYFSNLCQYCSVTSHVQDVITQRFPAFWRDKSTGLLGIG